MKSYSIYCNFAKVIEILFHLEVKHTLRQTRTRTRKLLRSSRLFKLNNFYLTWVQWMVIVTCRQ